MTMTLEAIGSRNREQIDGKLGSHISEAITWEDAVQMANLDWEVIERPLYFRYNDSYKRIEHRKAIVRTDTGTIVGDVGQSYQPIQNRDIGGFLTTLVEQGAAKFISAGEMQGGTRAFARLMIGEEFVLDLPDGDGYQQDQMRPELVINWSHDGSTALRASLVVMRLVCTNGLTVPVAARHLSIRHSGDTEKKLAVAQATSAFWFRYKERFEQAASRLAAKKMSWDEIQQFTEQLFPSKREQDGDEAAAQTQERRAALIAVLRQAPDLQQWQNTAWGVLNAVAEFADHVAPYADGKRTTAAERRFMGIVDGGAAQLQDRAFALLR